MNRTLDYASNLPYRDWEKNWIENQNNWNSHDRSTIILIIAKISLVKVKNKSKKGTFSL